MSYKGIGESASQQEIPQTPAGMVPPFDEKHEPFCSYIAYRYVNGSMESASIFAHLAEKDVEHFNQQVMGYAHVEASKFPGDWVVLRSCPQNPDMGYSTTRWTVVGPGSPGKSAVTPVVTANEEDYSYAKVAGVGALVVLGYYFFARK